MICSSQDSCIWSSTPRSLKRKHLPLETYWFHVQKQKGMWTARCFWTTAGAFLSIVITKTQQTQNNSSTSPTVWNCCFLDPKLEQISHKNFYLRSHRSLEHTFRENIPIENLSPAVLQQVPGTAVHGTRDPCAYCYCSAGFFSLPAISVTRIFLLNISRPYSNHTWEIAW